MQDNPDGPVDDRIGVLLFTDANAVHRLGLLVTCAAHATALKGENHYLSADFPGRLRELLEKTLCCSVLVRNGAAGNVNPLYRGGMDAHERMPLAGAGPVLSLVPELTPRSEASLWSGSETLPLLLRELPSVRKAERLARDWEVDTQPWLERVRTLRAQGKRTLELDIEVHLLRLGEFVLAGVPLEPFAELALAAQKRLGSSTVFFGGYTNGWLGYLPSEDECLHGGFEVEHVPATHGLASGAIMPPRPEMAEHVLEAVVRLHRRSLEERVAPP